MYKLFLTIRYLRSRRIAYFAIAAVTLCTAMVLIVMSVMGGWLEQVRQRARGLLGDVIVDNQRYAGMPLYEAFLDEIRDWPEIGAATPVIYTYGLYKLADTTLNGMIRVVGVRLEEVFDVNAFEESLYYEKFYPGTTTLAPQQQPVMGPAPDEPLVISPDGQEALYPPALPEPYQAALERSRSAGLTDDSSTQTIVDKTLQRYGLPPIPGVYAFSAGDPPHMEGNPLPGIILGRDLIASRQSDGRYERLGYLPRGCAVTLTLWNASVRGNVDPVPSKTVFRYVDDSRTGIYEIDSQHVYCDFALLQELLHMDQAVRVDEDTGEEIGTVPARCSQIQIKLAEGVKDPQAIAVLCTRLEEAYHELTKSHHDLSVDEHSLIQAVDAMTWQESQAHIIGPVEKERILVTILFGIISLVAVALILCILYMIVLQKTRDIGIVKAIGGSSSGVAMIFLIYGAAVGIVGSLLGSLLGVVFVWNINEIQDYLISINPAWRVWDLQVYSFDRIPSEVAATDLVVIVLIAIASATIGALAAAWRAGAMQPVEALRYE